MSKAEELISRARQLGILVEVEVDKSTDTKSEVTKQDVKTKT